MSDSLPATRTELAHRTSDGTDVTLFWQRADGRDGEEKVVVRVVDAQRGTFEIRAQPYLALDVYYHPFAYRDFSAIDDEDRQVAAA
jgi:hypothetical protein